MPCYAKPSPALLATWPCCWPLSWLMSCHLHLSSIIHDTKTQQDWDRGHKMHRRWCIKNLDSERRILGKFTWHMPLTKNVSYQHPSQAGSCICCRLASSPARPSHAHIDKYRISTWGLLTAAISHQQAGKSHPSIIYRPEQCWHSAQLSLNTRLHHFSQPQNCRRPSGMYLEIRPS